MKTRNLIYALMLFAFIGCNDDDDNGSIPSANIPDGNFYNYLLDNFDTNKNGKIDVNEANAVKTIDLSKYEKWQFDSLKGIEYFTNLEILNCGINVIYSVDISKNTALQSLNINSTGIETIDISNNKFLKELYCSKKEYGYNKNLSKIDISNNPLLEILDCSYNTIQEIDISNNPLLEILDCSYNTIQEIDITQNPELKELNIGYNDLTSIYLSKNTKLKKLYCEEVKIASLDISNSTIEVLSCTSDALKSLNAKGSKFLKSLTCTSEITTLDASESTIEEISCAGCSRGGRSTTVLLNDCPNLKEFVCRYSRFGQENPNSGTLSLNISNCPSLVRFDANVLANLNISNCTALKELDCIGLFVTLDCSTNTKLERIYCQSPNIKSIDLSSSPALKDVYCNGIYQTIDLSKNENIEKLICISDNLLSLDLTSLTKLNSFVCAIPYTFNTMFDFQQNRDLEEISINRMSEFGGEPKLHINASNLPKLKTFNSKFNFVSDINLSGCENLENVSILAGTSLNVSGCHSLKKLVCEQHRMESLDVSDCTNLDTLIIPGYYDNKLTSIKLNKNLQLLDCSNNLISSLDVSNNFKLVRLDCSSNNISDLNISGCSNIEYIGCSVNKISILNANECPDIKGLWCDNNNISSLLIDKCLKLSGLYCEANKLTELDVSKNHALVNLNCRSNPDLLQLYLYRNHTIQSLSKDNQTNIILKD